MTIRGDSTEYELLKKWCEELPFYEKPETVTTCEIGVREGLGSKIIMLGIRSRIGNIQYKHIGIDPYGNLKYQHYDNSKEYTADYTDDMRQRMEKDFSDHPEFVFLHMKDIDYMKKFSDQTTVFDLVHFDGPHMTKDVIREALYFADRSRKGSRFIFDDYTQYKINDIARLLQFWNFKIIDTGSNKICFQRI
tara:strand:+ start:1207 stop:1782 length:576 start_codon:yes stop_codon:yes gene_type:complete